ncbi:MAG TPA: hypothetical protein VHT03_06860 [Rhizomicrobium sp.]|jgi:hypothetical protein|nr:hypothetical protein [Rhizomicrobium sp.]
MPALARLLNPEIAVPRGEVLALLLLVPLLLLPDLWNRFPIIYYDTGAYIFEGLTGRFIPERAAAYSLFLRFAGADTSLWIIAVIQAAMSAFLLTQCARTVAPRMRWSVLLLVGSVLVIATSLPWYSGEIEPDCFTALVVLSLYLLAFRASVLGVWRAVAVALIGALAIAVHPSHLVLAGFLFVVLVALRLVWRAHAPRLVVPALVCLGGLFLVVGGNFHFTRQVFISRAGAPFVFARMLQDGIVMRLLDDTCPESGYRLCAYKDALPPTADGYLWTPRSPFFALGHFQGTAAESARIVRAAIARYPLLQLRAAFADTAAQFVRFKTGEGMEPQQWVLAPVFTQLMPQQAPAYLAARQQQGGFDFRVIGKVQSAIGFLSLAGMLALLIWFIRTKRAGDAALPLFVLAALLGNAMICGVLSGPHDRYQSRLMWLAPFVVMLSLHALRRTD